MAYAHAVIELSDRTIQRGEQVAEEVFSAETYAALVEGGALSDNEYDASSDKNEPPDVIEIDGVRYMKEQA